MVPAKPADIRSSKRRRAGGTSQKDKTMTAKQTARWNMMVAVLATLNLVKNKPVWSAHVAFSNAVAELAGITGEIEHCAKCQAASDGATEEKQQVLEQLGETAHEVAAGVKAYASANEDKFLLGKVDFSGTLLINGSASKVVARAETILDAATEVVDSLEDQQVTPAKLKNLENRIRAFRAVHSKPRQTTAASNAATRQLPRLFRKANALLTEQLDALAVQFKAALPAFHGEYQSARSIVDPATGRSGAPADDASITAPAKAA